MIDWREVPIAVRAEVERSAMLYGTGFVRRHHDGRFEHVPTDEVGVAHSQAPSEVLGRSVAEIMKDTP